MPIDHCDPTARALCSLRGLSVGNTFGERIFAIERF